MIFLINNLFLIEKYLFQGGSMLKGKFVAEFTTYQEGRKEEKFQCIGLGNVRVSRGAITTISMPDHPDLVMRDRKAFSDSPFIVVVFGKGRKNSLPEIRIYKPKGVTVEMFGKIVWQEE